MPAMHFQSTRLDPGVEEQSRDGHAGCPIEQTISGSTDVVGRCSAPTPANTSRIAPENGDPNGDPVRYQKRSQRVTRHPTGLVRPDVRRCQAQRGISAFGGPKKMVDRGRIELPTPGFSVPCSTN